MNTNCGTDSANKVAGRRDLNPGAPLGAILVTGLVLLLSFATRFSPAQTPMELMRWKEFSYAKQTNQLGGKLTAIDGIHRAGYIVLADGQFARVSSSLVHTTSPEGKEFYQGFVMYDFSDGSSILAKADVSGEPRSRQSGTLTFLAGTNRFKGITGRGTIASWMPTRWDLYVEVEASYAVAKDSADANR